MNNPLLILDVHGLAHRAYYTTGALSHNGRPTGVLFGIFRDIVLLQERFASTRIAFCFDSRQSKRKELYPDYKRRAPLLEGERDGLASLKQQIKALRKHLLLKIGFNNVFFASGYEADDLIARICEDLDTHEEAIVVSSDQDLYQVLVNGNIKIWQPQQAKVVTKQTFWAEYEIEPEYWAQAKAIAGCPGDNVPGAKGVGIKTAIKLINSPESNTKVKGKMLESAFAWYQSDMFKLSHALVKLPYEGTPSFELVSDDVSVSKWQEVMDSLGMKDLRKALPLSAKGKS